MVIVIQLVISFFNLLLVSCLITTQITCLSYCIHFLDFIVIIINLFIHHAYWLVTVTIITVTRAINADDLASIINSIPSFTFILTTITNLKVLIRDYQVFQGYLFNLIVNSLGFISYFIFIAIVLDFTSFLLSFLVNYSINSMFRQLNLQRSLTVIQFVKVDLYIEYFVDVFLIEIT